MRGDFSRRPYEYVLRYLAAATGYNAVLEQQGRVPLDADWNEQRALDQHRLLVETRDIIGACGAPTEHAGFAITPTSSNGKSLQIGIGRYYVHGMLCECVAASAGAHSVPLAQQPYLLHQPNQPQSSPYADVAKLLTDAKATGGIVYLDVWQQHLTALDDPLIREPALGGPDTTTRVRTVWQVKILPITSAPGSQLTCDSDFPEWTRLLASASTGMLSAQTKRPSDDSGPCDIPPTAGYLRLENQLYRVEVHQSGDLGTATFKWSRENGSVVTGIVSGGGKTLTVLDVGPDDTLGFGNGQWVEVSDDSTELNGQPGQLAQIDTVTAATRQITLRSALAGTVDPTLHPKLRAWNQSGTSASTSGVPISGSWLDLEGGIQVRFAQGSYRTGDYWVIPARTATGEIEWPPFTVPLTSPTPLPPLGNHHAFCRIALVSLVGNGTVRLQDCRTFFPPLTAPAGQTKLALHVVETSWHNDEVYPLPTLQKPGLVILFDHPPDMRSIKADTVIVRLEAPIVPVQTTHEVQIADQPEMSIILEGTIQPYQNGQPPTAIQWVASNATDVYVREFLVKTRGRALRVRVTLKGHDIWALNQPPAPQPGHGTVVGGMITAAAQQVRSAFGGMMGSAAPATLLPTMSMMSSAVPPTGTSPVMAAPLSPGAPQTAEGRVVVAATEATSQRSELLHLDGQAFGEPGIRLDGTTPRIGLRFPSGDGTRASDFESWFYIGLQGDAVPAKVQATTEAVAGTVTVDPAALAMISHVPRQ